MHIIMISMTCYFVKAHIVHGPTPIPSNRLYVDTGLNVTGVRSVVYSVKACKDAQVCVSSKPPCKGENFEVIVGSHTNAKSGIR